MSDNPLDPSTEGPADGGANPGGHDGGADGGADSGAEGPKAMGQVMRVLQPQVAGRAEGGRVAAEVRRQLGG